MQSVEVWLGSGRPHGTVLEPVETPMPELSKGEGLLDAIENRRRKARSLRDELAGVERAPFPSSYCKAQARQHVGRLAERGKPDVAALIRFDEDIAWPKENVRSQVYTEPQRALAFAELVDPVSILAWLDPAKLIAKLDAEIDRVSDDKHALSVEAREMKAAELQTALLEIERQESALVWTAQQQNLPCEH